MTKWREVWRDGIAPCISTPGLLALEKALTIDDPRLLQGATSSPPPMMCVQDWPCEAGCGICLCGWLGDGLGKVGEVEEYFARVCFEADKRLAEPAGVRWFLNWFDETPRDTMRSELLAEVRLELTHRPLPFTAVT